MAVLTYTIKRGDTLTKIAKEHSASISGNTIQQKINTLVKLNNIPNPNLIIAGDTLKLSGTTSSPSSTTQSGNKVTIKGFGLQAGSTTGRDMYVYWSWSRARTKGYSVRWEWFINGHLEWETSEVTVPYSNRDGIDQEAKYVQVFIRPIAENKLDSSGKDTGVPYWTDVVEVGEQYQFSKNPPLSPPIPNVELDNEKHTLTASISNIKSTELDAVGIKFNIVRDNSTSVYTSDSIPINTTSNYVSYLYANVEPGHTYTVRAQSVGANGNVSGWSDFSESVGTKPSAPSMVQEACRSVKRTDGSIAAHLEWNPVSNATSYKIEYVNIESDFVTTPDNIQSTTTENARTSLEIIVQPGSEYFFRVKAVNADGESDPSDTVRIPIGLTPAAPITWSTADAAFVGDIMELNWSHNVSDNSKQSAAQLQLNINDGGWILVGTFENTTDAYMTDERVDEAPFTYGTAISYKGSLRFKMDTTHADLRDAKIQWQVRTKGVTDEFGDWSVERTIRIYVKPSLSLSMTSDLAGTGALVSTLTSFPFYVRARDTLADHTMQKPVAYHLQITSQDYYETVDDVGRTKTIKSGDVVYSKFFETSDELIVEMSADNVDLVSGMNYTLYCVADMSTGLMIDNQHEFTVSWDDVGYAIDANISVNTDSYTALITPYCVEKIPAGPGGKNLINVDFTTATWKGVTITNNGDGSLTLTGKSTAAFGFNISDSFIIEKGIYTTSINRSLPSGVNVYSVDDGGTTFNFLNGGSSILVSTKAVTSKLSVFKIWIPSGVEFDGLVLYLQLEVGSIATDYEEYFEKYEDGELIENLTLAVYRREYDGSYTEVASGIPNNYTTVTDPHPSLDYARYRFIAKDVSTGAISFYDMAGYPVNASSIILQWAEEWSTFDSGEERTVEGPEWSGSLLRLPYNIKVTDKRKPEVALVEYAGRKHPVSYYGTQVGETSQWSVDIPKEDKETVYNLRRLSLWPGDVYVREPSGMGYWANVGVSFDQTYNEVTVPISLEITRVEGGV